MMSCVKKTKQKQNKNAPQCWTACCVNQSRGHSCSYIHNIHTHRNTHMCMYTHMYAHKTGVTLSLVRDCAIEIFNSWWKAPLACDQFKHACGLFSLRLQLPAVSNQQSILRPKGRRGPKPHFPSSSLLTLADACPPTET